MKQQLEKKTFWRIEHDTKHLGPYNSSNIDMRHHQNTKRWPGSQYGCIDPGLRNTFAELEFRFREKYIHGFESMASLRSWFSQRLRLEMFDEGFVIRTFESTDYYIGKKQVVFIPLSRD
jgi:hypothetical protein